VSLSHEFTTYGKQIYRLANASFKAFALTMRSLITGSASQRSNNSRMATFAAFSCLCFVTKQ
jgi:hypothetical protein